jgi:hypothetical protein
VPTWRFEFVACEESTRLFPRIARPRPIPAKDQFTVLEIARSHFIEAPTRAGVRGVALLWHPGIPLEFLGPSPWDIFGSSPDCAGP